MNLKEFLKSTGMKLAFLCDKTEVTRQTIYRITIGEAVSQEVSDRIKTFCKQFSGYDVDIPISNSSNPNVKNRSKKLVQSVIG